MEDRFFDIADKTIMAVLALFGTSGLVAGLLTMTWHNIVIGPCMFALAYAIYNEDYKKENRRLWHRKNTKH